MSLPAFASKIVLLMVVLCCNLALAERNIGINVALNQRVSDAVLADLAKYGKVRSTLSEINAVFMQVAESNLPVIQALPYVTAAGEDQPRETGPVSQPLPVENFMGGASTWALDSINVMDQGAAADVREVAFDGTGVYVAVLDSGLIPDWRSYFPVERIAMQFAKTFGAGGASNNGAISEPPLKWQKDQSSHGTHVTSSILGFQYLPTADNPTGRIGGTAPKATIIPVKVLNQNGSGWSSAIAHGIVYVTNLKRNNQLGNSPLVINMSLSGAILDAVEKNAVDFAIANNVIVVAAASNRGNAGMGFPGAYQPVISVAAGGFRGEFIPNNSWWRLNDLPEAFDPAHYYLANFSARPQPGQDMDVVGPGNFVVGPYQVNSQTSWFFLNGTSMSSPHIAGTVALMKQKNPALTAAQAEAILESTARFMGAGTNVVTATGTYSWPANATGSGWADARAALALVPAP